LEADILNVLGVVYYRLEQYDLAFTAYKEGLDIFEALGHHQGACKILINVAQAHSTLKQYDDAFAVGQKGIKIARETNSRMLEAHILHTVGQIYADSGAFEDALNYLEHSLTVAEEAGHRYVYLVSIIALGQVHTQLQQMEKAAACYRQGLELAEQLNTNLYIFRSHEVLAAYYEGKSDYAQALDHYKKFHSVKESVFNEKSQQRLQVLETNHRLENARKETEFYQMRNTALEEEINKRRILEKELHIQATTDSLTQAANRRRFIELLK
jgi:tetratricopeptide (TPR) repeat protein